MGGRGDLAVNIKTDLYFDRLAVEPTCFPIREVRNPEVLLAIL